MASLIRSADKGLLNRAPRSIIVDAGTLEKPLISCEILPLASFGQNEAWPIVKEIIPTKDECSTVKDDIGNYGTALLVGSPRGPRRKLGSQIHGRKSARRS
jgi:hypothetical protein